MGNALRCPPTMELVHRGILTGLGTDGYTHDMTESYKVANVLHKHHLCDPNTAWGEVPQMLFEGNVKIAERYFPQTLGVLKEGAAADVIVVDYDPLTPMTSTQCKQSYFIWHDRKTGGDDSGKWKSADERQNFFISMRQK